MSTAVHPRLLPRPTFRACRQMPAVLYRIGSSRGPVERGPPQAQLAQAERRSG